MLHGHQLQQQQKAITRGPSAGLLGRLRKHQFIAEQARGESPLVVKSIGLYLSVPFACHSSLEHDVGIPSYDAVVHIFALGCQH
jgi:hypothetical protein